MTKYRRKLTYLAAPFTHPDRLTMVHRVEQVNWMAAHMLREGEFVFSPLTHNWPLVQTCLLHDCSWDFWRHYDLNMIERCDELCVLRLRGWRESIGVMAEVGHADSLTMPVHFVSHPTVEAAENSFYRLHSNTI